MAAGCEQISQADAALTNAFELFRRRTMIAEKGAQLRAPSGATALGMTSWRLNSESGQRGARSDIWCASPRRICFTARAASAALVSVFHSHHVAHPQQVRTNSSVERWNPCKGRGRPQSKHSTTDMIVEGRKGGQSDACSNR